MSLSLKSCERFSSLYRKFANLPAAILATLDTSDNRFSGYGFYTGCLTDEVHITNMTDLDSRKVNSRLTVTVMPAEDAFWNLKLESMEQLIHYTKHFLDQEIVRIRVIQLDGRVVKTADLRLLPYEETVIELGEISKHYFYLKFSLL